LGAACLSGGLGAWGLRWCVQVFVKQRLDLLCAKAWLEQSEEIRQQAVALSVQEGMLCAHTSMVTFATTPEKYKQLKDKQRKGTSPKQMQDAVAAVRPCPRPRPSPPPLPSFEPAAPLLDRSESQLVSLKARIGTTKPAAAAAPAPRQLLAQLTRADASGAVRWW